MSSTSIVLIVLASGVYLTPTISIYTMLKKHDDKTPGFFTMQFRMRTYLKKYNHLNKIRNGKRALLSKLWYYTLFISIILFALAVVV